jgi:hypothetical protein
MMFEVEPEVLEKASLAKDSLNVIAMPLISKQREMIKKLIELANDR